MKGNGISWMDQPEVQEFQHWQEVDWLFVHLLQGESLERIVFLQVVVELEKMRVWFPNWKAVRYFVVLRLFY